MLSYFKMNVTGPEIENAVDQGLIRINPFEKSLVNPNSYNYRLSEELYVIQSGKLDSKKETEIQKIDFSEEGVVLLPGQVYLGSTYEEIGSDIYVPSLIGRSSMGRLGLFLQITADLGHLGTFHRWTLELTVVQPLRVYPKMIIGQVSFWKPDGEINQLYLGGYAHYSSPTKSKMHEKI